MSETTPQGYVNYVTSSFAAIIKAIIFIGLMLGGLLLAVFLRIGNVDGYSIFIYSSIVEAILVIMIFLLSKKGFLYVIPRQDNFASGPKKG